MIVEAAGKLSLLELGCDVFIWHLVHASLDEVGFLEASIPLYSPFEQAAHLCL